jgi:hypothetical protein
MGFIVSGGGGEPNVTYQIQNDLTLNEGLVPNVTKGTGLTFGPIGTGNQFMFPFILGMDYLATKIAIQVTQGAAISNIYIGIYELDDNFNLLNGTPIIDSGALASVTTGLKTSILGVPVQLYAGRKYGLSILALGGSPSVRGFDGFVWYGSTGNVMNLAIFEAGVTDGLKDPFTPNSMSSSQLQPAVTLFRN